MSNIDQSIFSLLRTALFDHQIDGKAFETLNERDWMELYRIAQFHKMTGILCDGIDMLPSNIRPPRQQWMHWLAEREKTEMRHKHKTRVLKHLLNLFEQHNIPAIELKGSTLSQYYPIPQHRHFSDIDLYHFDQHAQADKLIAETLHVTPHNDSHHHSKYNHHGVTIESHFDFVNTHTPPSNKAYEQMLKQLDPHGATFEALFLARHHSCHFASDRITLRNLCDWALFLQARSHEIDLTMVADAFRQFNMHHFVGALEAIRTRMLHMPTIPELHFEISEKLYLRVLNDILHGEFNVPDPEKPGLRRLVWKLRRHRVNHWKLSITCNDTYSATMVSSLLSHLKKPKSILKKM